MVEKTPAMQKQSPASAENIEREVARRYQLMQ